jgi:hypothetical protein
MGHDWKSNLLCNSLSEHMFHAVLCIGVIFNNKQVLILNNFIGHVSLTKHKSLPMTQNSASPLILNIVDIYIFVYAF